MNKARQLDKNQEKATSNDVLVKRYLATRANKGIGNLAEAKDKPYFGRVVYTDDSVGQI